MSTIKTSVKYLILLSFNLLGVEKSFSGEQALPKVGERVYLLAPSLKEDVDLAKPSEIMEETDISDGEVYLKDPLQDRKIELKKIIGKSSHIRYLAEGKKKSEPIEKTAFVTLKPMAITGKSNVPSIRLGVEREEVSPSDSVSAPSLLRGVFRDASKLK